MLASVKAGYIGRFINWKTTNSGRICFKNSNANLPADLWELHKNISAVTADDVLRVANKYFRK
jgi:predicted Zn-dependent peptidase